MTKEDVYAISALGFMSKSSRKRRLVANEYIEKYGEPPYIIDRTSFLSGDFERDIYCNFNFLVHCLFATYRNADIVVDDEFVFERVSVICGYLNDIFFWKSGQIDGGGFYKICAEKFFQIRGLARSIIEARGFSDFCLPKIEDVVNFGEFVPIFDFNDYF